MVRFKWVEWNVEKVAGHGLSIEEVEYAWEHRYGPHQEREDGAYETTGRCPSGRRILIVWRYDEEFDAPSEGQVAEVVFVLTAYGGGK